MSSCVNSYERINDIRVAFCVKLWLKELKELASPDNKKQWPVESIIWQLQDEIINGQYCSDEEFNNYLLTGKVI